MVHPKNVWVNGAAPALNADNMNNLEENAYNGALFAENYTDPTWTQVTGKPSTFAPIIGTTATTAKAGNWIPGEATAISYGTVKLSSNSLQGISAQPITQAPSRSYGVQRAVSGQLVVNVPWVNTTYTLPPATASVIGGVKSITAPVIDVTEPADAEQIQGEIQKIVNALKTAGVFL